VISVILPQYKHEQYLPDAVDSILNQTYQDWELLILNDDPDISLKDYERIDKRIKVYDCYVHIGQGTLLNRGIALAKGDYIAQQDADDISLPYRLQVSFDYLRENNLDFTYSDFIVLNPDGSQRYVNSNEWCLENLLNHAIGGEPTQFWRKSLKVPQLRDGYGKHDPWKLEIFYLTKKVKRLPLPLVLHRSATTQHRKPFQMRWKRYKLKQELRKLNENLINISE
jgi:glycosyltransferase involved in cell wall biosynthesis